MIENYLTTENLLWAVLVLTGLITILMVVFLLRISKVSQAFAKEMRDELRYSREETRSAGKELREEVSIGLKSTNDTLFKTLDGLGRSQQTQLELMTKQLKEHSESNQGSLDRIRSTFDSRIKELQGGNEKILQEMRKELSEGLKATNELLSKTLDGLGNVQQAKLEGMTKQLKEHAESNQTALDRIRTTFDFRVKELQESNEKKLNEMRKTVDEKLQDTLEKRLGESFKVVSDRLEAVHKGLGEMQNLATGVGDLKRVLTNVKARGTWAEFQIGAIWNKYSQ
jgi:DNA recombination protein RmuC